KDGKVVIRAVSLVDRLADRFGDKVRLGVVGRVTIDRHRRAFEILGEEFLVLSSSILANEPVGGGKDVLGAAVVFFEPDGDRVGEMLLEEENVVGIGAAPTVDALVGVSG